jgi:hypothetical protein
MRSYHGCKRRRKIAAANATQQRQQRSPVEKKTLSFSEAFQGSETPVPVVLIASLFRSFTFAWISSFSSALMRTPALNEERRVLQCKRSTDDASIYYKKKADKICRFIDQKIWEIFQKKKYFSCVSSANVARFLEKFA